MCLAIAKLYSCIPPANGLPPVNTPSSSAAPLKLRAVTTELSSRQDFPGVVFADPKNPLVWMNEDLELVARGEILSLHFTGADRFTAAKQAWQRLLSTLEESNELSRRGTGLLSFSSFSFDDNSSAPSLMIIPEVIYGRDSEKAWRTVITAQQAPSEEPADVQHSNEPLGELKLLHDFDLSSSAPGYLEAVAQAVSRIQQRQLDKVVLARQVSATVPADSDLRSLIEPLVEQYPECSIFALAGLIGASPETLLRSGGNQFSTRVLAGSAQRGSDAQQDQRSRDNLLHSAKDITEHIYARQSAINSLTPLAEDITAGDIFSLDLKNIRHLASDIGGTLFSEVSPLDALAALHPTAAVAGTPSTEAVALVAELEGFDRGRYAGPVGWLDSAHHGEWAIALRCASFERSEPESETLTVTAYAGCGIVADSEPAAELAETTLKLQPIVASLEALSN